MTRGYGQKRWQIFRPLDGDHGPKRCEYFDQESLGVRSRAMTTLRESCISNFSNPGWPAAFVTSQHKVLPTKVGWRVSTARQVASAFVTSQHKIKKRALTKWEILSSVVMIARRNHRTLWRYLYVPQFWNWKIFPPWLFCKNFVKITFYTDFTKIFWSGGKFPTLPYCVYLTCSKNQHLHTYRQMNVLTK